MNIRMLEENSFDNLPKYELLTTFNGHSLFAFFCFFVKSIFTFIHTKY